MTNQDYLKVAVAAANQSAKLFKTNFGNAGLVELKNNNPGDLVTNVDKKIEKLIRSIVKKNFPAHKIIGEEFEKDIVDKNDFVWVIDPIDGTTNYVYGIPFCCISIGLWDNKGPLVAVVNNPILKQVYTAVRGQGIKLNGKKTQVGNGATIKTAIGTVGWGKVRNEGQIIFSELIKDCFKIRVFASGTWQICMVASGNSDFYASMQENAWDFGAAVLMVTEAGGKVTDLKGRDINLKTRNLIASNGKVHDELVGRLKNL